ncbi:unknown [Roseburia sp. CAG:100]|nr:unknown [Roseburia sp. CAG:100]
MAHYLFYFGPYKISPFNMKRVFDGKMIAPSEFLDDVEEVLNRYDKEPVYSKNIKSDYRWNDANDRSLRNRFKIVFPGYELVSKVLRYEYGFNVSRWQLMLVINGIYSPSPELTSALEEIYNEAKQHVIANNFGSDYLDFKYCEPIEEVAKGDWYVPILLGNDTIITRHFKYKKMEKFCKLNGKRMQPACVHDMNISSIWDIQEAVDLAQEKFSTVLVYANWDYVDEDIKALICNYSKNHNVPLQYMFKDNRIA